MTIFPTHKTELKTKLSHHEILKRLENNDFYALGYSFSNGTKKTENLLISEKNN